MNGWNLFNLDGTMKEHWQIGYGKNAIAFTLEDNKLTLGKVEPEFDADGNEVRRLIFKVDAEFMLPDIIMKTDQVPKDPDDIVNLKALQAALKYLDEETKIYIMQVIQSIEAGGDGTPGIAGTMPTPYILEAASIANGGSVIIGEVKPGKFIDRIIVEPMEGFAFPPDVTAYISIGTPDDKQCFLTKTNVTTFNKTYVSNVYQTMDNLTSLVLYMYRDGEDPIPEPDPDEPDPNIREGYEQKVYIEHKGITGTLTHDYSERVWTITFTGNVDEPSITFPELWGNAPSGNYIDFAFNIPVAVGRKYRIAQRNANLELFPDDPYISNETGEWIKDRSYTFTEKDFDEDGEVLMAVLLAPTTGNFDFAHFHFYDLSGSTPEESYYTIHIKNEVTFNGVTPSSDEPQEMPDAQAVLLQDDSSIESDETPLSRAVTSFGKCRIRTLVFGGNESYGSDTSGNGCNCKPLEFLTVEEIDKLVT